VAAIAPRAQLKRSRSGRQEAIFPMFVVEQCRETVRPFRCSSRNDKQESGSDQKSTDDVQVRSHDRAQCREDKELPRDVA